MTESTTTEETISEDLIQLGELTTSRADPTEIIQKLVALKAECDKGLDNKIQLGNLGAYETILNTLTIYNQYRDVTKQSLKTLIALMSKQPDLLDDKGVAVILSLLKREVDGDLKKLALKLTRECCIMHEMNRQKVVNANIVENLKEFLKDGNPDLMKDTLTACRVLVLDDDIRVQFSKAHEHAKVIGWETLCPLTALLTRYKQEDEFIGEIMAAIRALMVRTEFCKKVEDAGALPVIKDVMLFFKTDEKIIRQCFKLLQAISGNDDCKVHIIQNGFAPVVTSTLNANKEVVSVTVAGLQCVAALCLRCPENSKAFTDTGVSEVIVNIMRLHPEEEMVQKTACWAIRNMVARYKCQGKVFLDLGVEELLQSDLRNFKEIEYDIRAALRDLNCNVHLKEDCTGKGTALSTSSVN